ncbi:beta-N-acetylglucosaminidase [Elizabethkingia meningoseptica]|uniref:beta-N-acetylhexosaminidase n=1 Tax=Elizabethkingia meningoseptica TaxID=238 RepID=UPI000332D63D|nr:beta-N-acetylhexosaminidase [Elizabethkingia meningoseptica]AQX04110.1 beta-N-acetylglucosaminidase [Elizabethkingia meningoseptica]AQX46151.1 beta-N-acetylglucosaminidase [Elizabethkingia meningoseptica]EOR28619.1 beta-hexosaminidase [Elizabethkingia meningoseptica ATCC 13253 = NBRC 12535]KUY15443.1 beta-N-acetylglucosaminidase [Elizabethkingia meningoseptica]MDE5488922.1 beta-N-acetylhexosaminidase [Elizabethkingia meningoseptica]
MRRRLTRFGLLFFTACSFYAQEISVIPMPQEIIQKKDHFTINQNTGIQLKGVMENDVRLFADQLRKATGYKLPIVKKNGDNTLVFQINKALNLPDQDGYTIEVSDKNIIINAQSGNGIFYATQTLRQLLPAAVEVEQAKPQEWMIPGVVIKDYPRYSWRGYMKDVSRTFYGVDVIKKYLDLMALYKMNTFHWHLTDDQGWRIEIKKYPKLTSEQTTVFHRTENQPAERSGFYTQEQIKEIVAYARDRKITIVPEIDVPGHSWPTILAYPQLGVNKNSYPYYVFPFVSSWGYWGNQFTPNTLDPTKEEVYTFLQNVFTEVAALFPGEYIHFGGDEVKHIFWEKEPHVQQFMSEHKINGVKQLQSYFVQRVSGIIKKLGKKPIGWNDVLADDKGLPKETAIMSWLGEEAIKEAASHGFKAVATPYSHVYLDITQADRNDGTPSDLAYSNINSIDRIYAYDPSTGLTKEEEKFVLGIQGNLWSALTQEAKDMNVHVFPRLLAVAEVGWTLPEHKNFDGFKRRLQAGEKRLDVLKVDYYHPGGYIAGKWSENDIKETFADLSFDVTSKVYANGRVVTGFFFTSGKNFLEIDGVQLLEDGNIISEDLHHALADTFRGTNKIKPFYYNLKVAHYNPNAKYTVRAKVRGAGGTDSKGNFTFNLSPYKPFTNVESR